MGVARIDHAPSVPDPVASVLEGIARAGGRAWLVGGTVRDLLLGDVPRDFDVATDLEPQHVLRAFPDADARDSRFGVCRIPSIGEPISVTTLRREGTYADRRRPDAVEFVADPAVDAVRRDFTVNALYLDVGRREVFDPCGGLLDLEARSLRCIGDAELRFDEDPLRLLRAIRFAARCGLSVEGSTSAAIRARAGGAATLSAERTFAELTDSFTGRGRGRALELLVRFGIAAVLLPEVAAMDGVTQPPEYHPEGDVLTHVCLVLGHVPEGDAVLSWSAVLHDVGKPPTWRQAEDRIRFDGHDTLSASMADDVLRRLRAPADLREAVVEVCRDHIRFAALPKMRPRRAERWMRSPHFAKHLAFHRADCLGSHADLSSWDFAQAKFAALAPETEPLVTGADVLELGVPSGPRIGALIRAVHDAADEGPVAMDRPAALILLRELVERDRQGGADRAR